MERLSNETDSLLKSIETAIPKSKLYWFFISLAAAIIWTIYLAYYNSRVMGLITSLILNKFHKYGRINIGKYCFLFYKPIDNVLGYMKKMYFCSNHFFQSRLLDHWTY